MAKVSGGLSGLVDPYNMGNRYKPLKTADTSYQTTHQRMLSAITEQLGLTIYPFSERRWYLEQCYSIFVNSYVELLESDK